MIEPKRMRQSLIEAAQICGLRAQYQFTDPVRTTSLPRLRGQGWHALMEVYYKERQEHGFFLPDLDRIDAWVHQQNVVSALDEEVAALDEPFDWQGKWPGLLDAIEEMAILYFSRYVWPSEYRVLAVEYPFDHAWRSGWVKHGTIDLVLHHEALDLIVVDDHKTANKNWPGDRQNPRKKPQGPWYYEAAREIFPGHNGYEFWYSVMRADAGAFQRRHVVPTDSQVRATVTRAAALADALDSGAQLLASPDHYLCSDEHCDHWSRCPFGAGAT